MALSGSFSGSILSGHYKLRVDWSVTQNVANNTSKITAVMYLVNDWGLIISGRSDNSTHIAGTQKTWSSPAINGKGTTKLGTVTSGDITHNADGTKSVPISATFYVRATIDGTYYEKITASATVTLNTIPRATTPTFHASSVDMEGTLTIYTSRASDKFKHDLAYSFAGGAWVPFATDVETWYAWKVPDLATSIPNATSGTMTIRCITKNGGTTVGTKTGLVTVKVPTTSAYMPSITKVTTTEATSGLAAQFGAFIQGKSKITANITAGGAKGSTIKSYSTTFAGKTYTGSGWTSDVVGSSGTLNLVTTATDSRGRTATKTTPITVLAYTTPKIYAFSAYRRNAAGAPDDNGNLIAVRYNYEVDKLNNGNTAKLRVEYKRSTATQWSTLLTGSSLSANTTQSPASPTFSVDYQYDLRLTVTDYFGADSSYLATLPSGAVILDIHASGQGIAFGKTADQDGVDFGWSPKGAVLGLGWATSFVQSGEDLNDYTRPGVYGIDEDREAVSIANCPVPCAGTLRVWSAVGSKFSGPWTYLIQEYHPYRALPVCRRHVTAGADGAWSFGKWVPQYGSQAGSITLNSDVTVTQKKLTQHGGLVYFNLRASISKALNAGVTSVIGTIPEGFRPDHTAIGIGWVGSVGTMTAAIRPNGEIVVASHQAYTAGTLISFTVVWDL